MPSSKPQLNVRIGRSTLAQVHQAAERAGVTVNAWVETALARSAAAALDGSAPVHQSELPVEPAKAAEDLTALVAESLDEEAIKDGAAAIMNLTGGEGFTRSPSTGKRNSTCPHGRMATVRCPTCDKEKT